MQIHSLRGVAISYDQLLQARYQLALRAYSVFALRYSTFELNRVNFFQRALQASECGGERVALIVQTLNQLG